MMTPAGMVLEKSEIHLMNIDEGSIIAALLLNDDIHESVWCLFYEQGGNWTCFGDGDEYDAELAEWMPDAVKECAEKMIEIFSDSEQINEDMHWFLDWAAAAEKTLFIKKIEEKIQENGYTQIGDDSGIFLESKEYRMTEYESWLEEAPSLKEREEMGATQKELDKYYEDLNADYSKCNFWIVPDNGETPTGYDTVKEALESME